jgi:hypothetical protein
MISTRILKKSQNSALKRINTLAANSERHCVIVPATSQRPQIIRHVAELSQHSCIAEIAGRRITCATERDRTCMAQYLPKALRTLYRGCGTGFTNNDAAVSNIKRQCHEVCNPGHDRHPV